MTDQQKKMKKYCAAVERRLNLPRSVKVRVMSDFSSSIQARREAGQTDEEIYAELGTPKEVAAELSQQMKEYVYRKSPCRFLFLAAAILSGGWLVFYAGMQMVLRFIANAFTSESASIGVIGGADGPTAIFITTGTVMDWDALIMGLICALGLILFLRLRKCKPKQ